MLIKRDRRPEHVVQLELCNHYWMLLFPDEREVLADLNADSEFSAKQKKQIRELARAVSIGLT